MQYKKRVVTFHCNKTRVAFWCDCVAVDSAASVMSVTLNATTVIVGLWHIYTYIRCCIVSRTVTQKFVIFEIFSTSLPFYLRAYSAVLLIFVNS